MIKPNHTESPPDLSSENLLVWSLHTEYIHLKSTRDFTCTFQYYYIIMDYYL